MLSRPVLARCDNRAQLARKNQAYGEPDDWMTSAGLAQLGLAAISFDFFIDWSERPPKVEDELWVKRISRVPVGSLTSDQVRDGAEACGDDLTSLEAFAGAYGFSPQYIIFRDGVDWQRAPEDLLVTTLNSGGFPALSMVTLSQIEDAVRRLSGGAVRIGGKGLTYGTSTLECHLASHTDALWPGDADCVLWNPAEGRAVALLEFKKHNLATPLANENIRQYMAQDRRKWQRLGLLRDRLNAPFFCVYYSTNLGVDQIKIERLEGAPDALRDAGSTMITIRGMQPVEIGRTIAAIV